ncbi:conserved hypothetical protein [Cenarchaeum symbiosum A]|uniref:Protein CENSYa_1923 n=1 Tax=Cenarchaeum symbiosum (strain A) TaxID=414004 RepID=A0RYW5_CENSY|nr:conserved hypothetical protein [Cenarchaeum symbiosum A]
MGVLSAALTQEDGEALVRAARAAVTAFLEGRQAGPDPGLESRLPDSGVFVTLQRKGSLRGCIGYTEPQRLARALHDAAIAAATQDPRFEPVAADELGDITFEVTVLTPPERITVDHPSEYPSRITVGRDGLVVRRGSDSGLLLPQVPAEYNWDSAEFLSHTCIKAGLERDVWRTKDLEVYRFGGTVFREEEPCGRISGG